MPYGFRPRAAFVAMELNEPFAFTQAPSGYACVEVLHRLQVGHGRARRTTGSRAHPAMCEFHPKVGPGGSIGERQGASQDVGYLLRQFLPAGTAWHCWMVPATACRSPAAKSRCRNGDAPTGSASDSFPHGRQGSYSGIDRSCRESRG